MNNDITSVMNRINQIKKRFGLVKQNKVSENDNVKVSFKKELSKKINEDIKVKEPDDISKLNKSVNVSKTNDITPNQIDLLKKFVTGMSPEKNPLNSGMNVDSIKKIIEIYKSNSDNK